MEGLQVRTPVQGMVTAEMMARTILTKTYKYPTGAKGAIGTKQIKSMSHKGKENNRSIKVPHKRIPAGQK